MLVLERARMVQDSEGDAGGAASTVGRCNTFWLNEFFTTDSPTYVFLAVSVCLPPPYILLLLHRGAAPDLHVELDSDLSQLDVSVLTTKGKRMSPSAWSALLNDKA